MWRTHLKQHTDHLFLSFSLGGWKLLLDIRNKALSGTETQIYWLTMATGGRFNHRSGGGERGKTEAAVMESSDERLWGKTRSADWSVSRALSLPHGMQVEHGRLQLGELDGGDADGPDVAQLVVTAIFLHSCHFRSHPVKNKEEQNSALKQELMFP